jgi:hypothetical protein
MTIAAVMLSFVTLFVLISQTQVRAFTFSQDTRVTTTVPKGWFQNGSRPTRFAVGVDGQQTYANRPSLYIKSVDRVNKDDCSGVMQICSAQNFIGKRVRLSAWIKTERADGDATLVLRADGTPGILRFNHLGTDAPQGSVDWTHYAVSLRVPEGSINLVYGFVLRDSGTAWFNQVVFEEALAENDDATGQLARFRAKHDMSTLSESKGVLLQKIGMLGSSVVAAEREQAELRTILSTVKAYQRENRDLLELAVIRSFGQVVTLKSQLEELKMKRTIMGEKFFDQYPAMQENALALSLIDKRLGDTVMLAVRDLESRVRIAQAQEKQIRELLDEAQEGARAFDQIALDYQSLEQSLAKRNQWQGTEALDDGMPGVYAAGALAFKVPATASFWGTPTRIAPEHLDFK